RAQGSFAVDHASSAFVGLTPEERSGNEISNQSRFDDKRTGGVGQRPLGARGGQRGIKWRQQYRFHHRLQSRVQRMSEASGQRQERLQRSGRAAPGLTGT